MQLIQDSRQLQKEIMDCLLPAFQIQKNNTEEYTIHEFAHQYFYGILASNEAEEPWMDEGFTSYATQKILAHTYGLHSSASTFLNMNIGAHDVRKNSYMKKPSRGTVVQPSWELNRGNYGVNTYSKPTLILLTLEKYLGEALMDRIMKAYLEKWKFQHPRTQDFIDIVNEMAPQNLDWFFQQALYDSCTLDYSVKSISLEENRTIESENKWFTNQVIVTREGEFIIPTEIQLVFTNRDTLFKKWNGKDSILVLKFPGPSPLVSAWVDPEQKLWLDLNWTNNSLTTEPQKVTIYRYLLGMLKIYQQLLGSLFFY